MSRFFRKTLNCLGSVFLVYLVQQCMLPTVCEGTEFSVSLDGSYEYSQKAGTVLIYEDGSRQAQKVCTLDSTTKQDWRLASVVCRQLRYGPPVVAKAKYDGTLTSWNSLDSGYLTCDGKEATLSDCLYSPPNDTNPTSCRNYALEVKCLPSTAKEFSLAISDNGYLEGGGTVFTFVEGRWGPICNYDYDDYDLAQVICKQLGSDAGGTTFGGEVFEDPVLYCSSYDDSLAACSRDTFFYTPECQYSQGAIQAYCFNNTHQFNNYDSDDFEFSYPTYPEDRIAVSPSIYGTIFFVFICTCVGGICYCVCCRKGNGRTRNGQSMGHTMTTMTSPPVVVPPPPYKDVVALPGQGPTMVYPPPGSNQGYPQTGCPTYPPGLGYPLAPGYPSATAPGYLPVTAPGYPPATAPGYLPATAPGYPPVTAPGYPPVTAPGYPPATAPGYPPVTAPGYPPATAPESGYPPPGYPSAPAPPPGYPQQEYPMTATSYQSSAGSGYPTQSSPAPISGTTASPPPAYPAGPQDFQPSVASQDIQPQPYPAEGVVPYPTAPGPPGAQDAPPASATQLENQVLDKV